MLVEDIGYTILNYQNEINSTLVDCYHFASPLFGHFRLCSENERESIDDLLYTSTVKNKGLVGNIPGRAVLFYGP